MSHRELDVLRLLDSELTGPEIARELYVTLNTLRTHTKRIFTKLDVTTRAAAVRRARERGLSRPCASHRSSHHLVTRSHPRFLRCDMTITPTGAATAATSTAVEDGLSTRRLNVMRSATRSWAWDWSSSDGPVSSRTLHPFL